MTSLARAFGTLLALGFALAASAAVPFDIPAQSASSALKTFGKQAKVEVLFRSEEVKNVQTKALKGDLEPTQALDQLLVGSGLTARQTSPTNFVVAVPAPERPGSIEGSVREEKSGRPVAGAKVTIAGTDTEVLTDRRGRFTLDGVSSGDHVLMVLAEGMQDTKVTDVTVRAGHRLSLSVIGVPLKQEGPLNLEPYTVSAKKNEGVIELDPYAVAGRKEKPFTVNMDIPRSIDDAQPYFVFDAKAIDTSGAVSIEDFLKQRLTMNSAGQSFSETMEPTGLTSAFFVPSGGSINLRGLGTDKTLVLVNGRRVPGVRLEGNESLQDMQPDLRGIPLSAIERIEVLPTSASGIYGGSAIGGVINVILKRDYSGGELRLGYDNVWDADAPRRNATLIYGLSLEGGRTRVTLSASWSDSKPLLLADRRALLEDNIATIQRNSPNFFISSNSPWLGVLPNIVNSTSIAGIPNPLILKNGTILSSGITHIAPGITPATPSAQLNSSLQANAGKWNLELPPTNQSPNGLLNQFGGEQKSEAYRFGIRRKMLPRLELFAEMTYDTSVAWSLDGGISGAFVPASAPTNPFTTAVFIRYPSNTGALPLESQVTNASATIGVIFDGPWGWLAELDYTWSRNRYNSLLNQNDSDAAAADIASGLLNPFVDTLANPLNLSRYDAPTRFTSATQMDDFSFRAAGDLPALLPWNSPRPSVALGLQHRVVNNPSRVADIVWPLRPFNTSVRTYYERESRTSSGYGEVTLPLVEPRVVRLLHSLELQAAGRAERFDVDTGTSGHFHFTQRNPPVIQYQGPTQNGQPFSSRADYVSNNFTFGVKYQPVSTVIVRASSATAFLPPSPTQLVKNPLPNPVPLSVTDPVVGSRYAVQILAGGNPELTPQNSESLNTGIIWQPRLSRFGSFRFNAEYYRIKQFDAIGGLSAQVLVDNEQSFPSRITRGTDGRITLVDTSLLNLYYRETEGWDFTVDYALETRIGKISFRASESIISSLKTQFTRTAPAVETVGYPSEGGAAKHKGNWGVGWEWRNWSAGWNGRYYGSYKQWGAVSERRTQEDSSYIGPQGNDTIPSQSYHDVHFGYRLRPRDADASDRRSFRASLWSDITIRAGVRNILNDAPPLDVFYGASYYFLSPYGDTRMRSYWVNVSKAF